MVLCRRFPRALSTIFDYKGFSKLWEKEEKEKEITTHVSWWPSLQNITLLILQCVCGKVVWWVEVNTSFFKSSFLNVCQWKRDPYNPTVIFFKPDGNDGKLLALPCLLQLQSRCVRSPFLMSQQATIFPVWWPKGDALHNFGKAQRWITVCHRFNKEDTQRFSQKKHDLHQVSTFTSSNHRLSEKSMQPSEKLKMQLVLWRGGGLFVRLRLSTSGGQKKNPAKTKRQSGSNPWRENGAFFHESLCAPERSSSYFSISA